MGSSVAIALQTTYTGINCETCHEHGGGLRAIKGTTAAGGTLVNWDPNNNKKVDQFDLCTSCHTFYNYDGTLLLVDGNPLTAGGGSVTTGVVGHHETSWYRIIASIHYDNPNTGLGAKSVAVGTANVIEGYNLRKTGSNPCFECHAHEAKTNTRTAGTTPADATIHSDWAQSAHAGGLLARKYANASSVATVMAVGVIDDTSGAATTRDPATTVSYPDISGSNTCMTCHLGRETGEVIKNDQDPDGVRSFVNSHYLSAGGQLFGTTGYEYAGVSYANKSFFQHDKVGSAAAPGTGTNGPCAGCHMSTPNSHSFLPVTKDSTGAITAITSTACVTCHSDLTPADLTTEEEEYQAALEALKQTLNGKGIYFFEAHPYFYIGPDGTGGAFTNWSGVYDLARWKDVMGAAFNYNLLFHDPGGYAHNRFYSKRLIWDSIDFISDGTLGSDVPAVIDAQVTALRLDSITAAAAKTYLGTTRP